jgi:hypothetical protein
MRQQIELTIVTPASEGARTVPDDPLVMNSDLNLADA